MRTFVCLADLCSCTANQIKNSEGIQSKAATHLAMAWSAMISEGNNQKMLNAEGQ